MNSIYHLYIKSRINSLKTNETVATTKINSQITPSLSLGEKSSRISFGLGIGSVHCVIIIGLCLVITKAFQKSVVIYFVHVCLIHLLRKSWNLFHTESFLLMIPTEELNSQDLGLLWLRYCPQICSTGRKRKAFSWLLSPWVRVGLKTWEGWKRGVWIEWKLEWPLLHRISGSGS